MTPPNPLFQVDPAVFERFPDYVVGCVIARDVDLSGRSQVILDLLSDAEARARITYASGDVKEYPEIAVWRSAFSTAGWSASKYPASAEAIIKRVVRGADLPRINDAVDLANAAVLFYGVPIGAHDVASLDAGPLTVRESSGNDSFQPLGDSDDERPDDSEIVYASGPDIRTRRWVWRQSRTARIDEQATTIFFPVDGFYESTFSRVEAAVEFLGRVSWDSLGADVRTGFVDRRTPEFSPED